MTPQREGKHVSRAIRTIPLEAIEPFITAEESGGDGLWCLVGSDLQFVLAHGGECVSNWDDALMFAQYVRWVKSRPERVHDNYDGALAFVRAVLGGGGKA